MAATQALLGGALDPHAAFLVGRGLRTLGLRVGAACANALAVARALDAHPAVGGYFMGVGGWGEGAEIKGLSESGVNGAAWTDGHCCLSMLGQADC